MFVELGKESITPEEIRLNFTLPYMTFWNHYFPDLTKKKQDAMYEKYIHQVGDPELYPHVAETFHFLHEHGAKICVLSSDPVSKLFPEIEKSGLQDIIEKTVGNVHEKADMIEQLVNEYDLEKEHTYYVGDTSGDVKAGKAARVKTIGITWGFQHRDILAKSHPDFLIDDIIEIKNLTKDLCQKNTTQPKKHRKSRQQLGSTGIQSNLISSNLPTA